MRVKEVHLTVDPEECGEYYILGAFTNNNAACRYADWLETTQDYEEESLRVEYMKIYDSLEEARGD